MNTYDFKLDIFEGPLDLLLHLIEKNQIDIYDIPIVHITSQYMEILNTWNQFDIVYSSEFLVMAATLLQIKSRLLLPKSNGNDEQTIDDPRDELVNRLVEFKRIKELTLVLDERVAEGSYVFNRPEELSEIGLDVVCSVEWDALVACFQKVQERYNRPEIDVPKVTLEREEYTLEQGIEDVLLVTRGKQVSCMELFEKTTSKEEGVVTFLALLELMKRQLLRIIVGDHDVYSIIVEGVGEEEIR
ncbi:ScpA family protein [Veillonella sp. CHU740]|uniref:segregation and condensation protein A n=1 Tax=Veillonella sp. CHU740 TaxID=2490950 RepID=UPI000F8F49C0|nr:segregation/condensation protein A [Veillonella sp. CHU740]